MNTIDSIKKVINDNHLTMDEELNILNLLVNKYNFLSVSEYARKENISQPASLKRLKSGKVMYVEMIGRKFIIG